jgi:hypothetical protein
MMSAASLSQYSVGRNQKKDTGSACENRGVAACEFQEPNIMKRHLFEARLTNACRVVYTASRRLVGRYGSRFADCAAIRKFLARLTFAVFCIGAGSVVTAQSEHGTAVPNADLARTAEVSVSGELDGFSKFNAIDGNPATEWASQGGHPWIALNWKAPQQIGRIVVRGQSNAENRAQGGKVRFNDGSIVHIDGIAPGGAPCETRFAPRMVTSLRFDMFSALGRNPGLAEIEVYFDSSDLVQPAESFPAPGTLVSIPENDPRIETADNVQAGDWCAAAWCRFAGTSVRVVGSTGPRSGMADVYIDGIGRKTVDWYSQNPADGKVVFSAENLADGKHIVGIMTRGAKNAASQGTSIHWSRIEYVAGKYPERFVPAARERFDPNVPLWLDTSGEPIQCHMGGIMFFDGRYYMLGSDWRSSKIPGFFADWCKNRGMVVYSSRDLMNWTFHGGFCGESNDPESPLYDYTIAAGRGKLMRAAGTGKFIALFQMVDNSFREVNSTGIAVADKPEGPYRWHGFLQMDGKPVQGADTAVFTDDDGKQYFITGKHADDWNVADCLYELSPDGLNVVRAKVLGTGGEAPAIFKHDGIYYLLHSELTGLNVNENFYHTATDIWGPWKAMGKIAQGDHAKNTFLTQTTDVVAVAGKPGAFIWIGDSLRNNALPTSRTVWLPVTIKGKGEMELRWRDSWDLSAFGN